MMTTSTNTTALAHSSDADFRAWGLELSNMLTAAGLPKSTDTGQVDWATVARPGTNTYAYEIRYLNDSLHGSKPLYIKIEYGTGASATTPAIRVSAASGTNGAGTLSGTTYFSATVITPGNAVRAGTWWSGAVAAIDGFAGFVWKREGQLTGRCPHFFVARLSDSAGSPSTAGFVFYYMNLSGPSIRTTYVGGASYSDSSGYCMFPGSLANTSTLVSGSPQVARHYAMTPEVQVVPYLLSFVSSEIGDLSTFTFTPVGATSRTYLALAGSAGPLNCGMYIGGDFSNARLAIQWE